MELSHEFTVPVPPEQAWDVLTDVERIAPCMPGAQLQEVAGDEYRGVVKVKVGPITAQYKGKASFIEQDSAGRRAVLRAEGRDTRGQGNANATITATLLPEDGGTRVQVLTDLAVTGKVAQFGRGVLADVSSKLLDQFVARLEADVLSQPAPGAPPVQAAEPEAAAAAPPAGTGEAANASNGSGGSAGSGDPQKVVEHETTAAEPAWAPVRTIDSAEVAPVDLLQAAGAPVGRRLVPVGVVAAILVLWLWRRRRS